MMEIFAVMICFAGKPTDKEICYLAGSRYAGTTYTYSSADTCELGRKKLEAEAHGSPAWTYTCVRKSVPTWQPAK